MQLSTSLDELSTLLNCEGNSFALSDLQYDLPALLEYREERSFWIREWARSRFPHYADAAGKFQTRETLRGMRPLKSVPSILCRTSGTTGSRFHYKSWRRADIMRAKNDIILREFAVPARPRVLKLVPDKDVPDISLQIIQTGPRQPLCSAGAQQAQTYWFGYNPSLEGPQMAQQLSHLLLTRGLSSFHVLISSWSTMQAWLDSRRSTSLAGLLYTTCETVNQEGAKQLVSQGTVGAVCDNMRCWDGGASFFQCDYGTYHTYDWLCDMQEDNGELVCTDYFNPVFPFIDYKNGDRCKIDTDWQQCNCGRWYREFKFFGKRPSFVVNMPDRQVTSIQITDAVDSIPRLSQAICWEDAIEIRTTYRSLPTALRDRLYGMLGPHVTIQCGGFVRTGDRRKFQTTVFHARRRRR